MSPVALRRSAFRTAGEPFAPANPDAFHRALAHFNRRRLAVTTPGHNWQHELDDERAMRELEGYWIEAARAEIAEAAAAAPIDVDGFVAWFEALEATGPGQHDPLFDWLADAATLDQMRWFLAQEVAGEAGFDDLVALTQVKLTPAVAKLELARNYWDEMGRGNLKGMHGPMLGVLVQDLGLDAAIETTVWESLALANTMAAFATTRRYAWHSVGALGVIELTAPGRSAKTAKGLRRLGLSDRQRRYFDLHAVLDVKHSADWNREVLRPVLAADPAAGRYIAEGALMRLMCGAACFARYRAHLWSAPHVAVA